MPVASASPAKVEWAEQVIRKECGRKVVGSKDKLAQTNKESWNLCFTSVIGSNHSAEGNLPERVVFCIIKLKALALELEMLEER